MLFVFITLVLIAIVSKIGYIPIGIGSLDEMHLTPPWQQDGFGIYYKRLEQGTFERPQSDRKGESVIKAFP